MDKSELYFQRGPKICTSVANPWYPFCVERRAKEEKQIPEGVWGKGHRAAI